MAAICLITILRHCFARFLDSYVLLACFGVDLVFAILDPIVPCLSFGSIATAGK